MLAFARLARIESARALDSCCEHYPLRLLCVTKTGTWECLGETKRE